MEAFPPLVILHPILKSIKDEKGIFSMYKHFVEKNWIKYLQHSNVTKKNLTFNKMYIFSNMVSTIFSKFGIDSFKFGNDFQHVLTSIHCIDR